MASILEQILANTTESLVLPKDYGPSRLYAEYKTAETEALNILFTGLDWKSWSIGHRLHRVKVLVTAPTLPKEMSEAAVLLREVAWKRKLMLVHFPFTDPAAQNGHAYVIAAQEEMNRILVARFGLDDDEHKPRKPRKKPSVAVQKTEPAPKPSAVIDMDTDIDTEMDTDMDTEMEDYTEEQPAQDDEGGESSRTAQTASGQGLDPEAAAAAKAAEKLTMDEQGYSEFLNIIVSTVSRLVDLWKIEDTDSEIALASLGQYMLDKSSSENSDFKALLMNRSRVMSM